MRKIPARTRKPTKEDVDDAPAPAGLAYLDEACALLGVSRDTIERAVKAGRLKIADGPRAPLGRRREPTGDVRRHIGRVSRESTTQTGRRGYRQPP